MLGIHPKQHQATKHLLAQFETAEATANAGTWMKKPLNLPKNTPNTASETDNTANNASESVTKPAEKSHTAPDTAASELSAAAEQPAQPAPIPFKPKSDRYYRRELPHSNDEYYAMKLYRKTFNICKARSSGDDVPPRII